MITSFIYEDSEIKSQNLDKSFHKGDYILIDGREYIIAKSIYDSDNHKILVYLTDETYIC